MTNPTAREIMANELVERQENMAISEAFEVVDRIQRVLASAGLEIVDKGAVAFNWPPNVQPSQPVELQNGDFQIVDTIEDAPLVTIILHNGTSIRARKE